MRSSSSATVLLCLALGADVVWFGAGHAPSRHEHGPETEADDDVWSLEQYHSSVQW